jgi:hypothetical protein
MRRVLKNLEIVLGAPAFVATVAESIVGNAEVRRWKQIVAIRVARECARFTYQRINHVPVMHRVPIAANESRQCVHEPIGVPDFDTIGEQPRFDDFTTQPAMHRISIAVNVDQTSGIDAATHLQAR